jgi:hypothetical protein
VHGWALCLCSIIVKRFLVNWWKDLNKTLTTDAFVDTKTIHRFDPPLAHMGTLSTLLPAVRGPS